MVFNLLIFPFVVNAQSSAALKKQQNQIRNEIKKLNSILQDIDVDKRWQELIDFEAEVIQNYGKSETIHG